VTRALGDAYLKVKEFSAMPFSEFCPYISCMPTISHRKLSPTDSYIVLASGEFDEKTRRS
jgi:serine/threonine protein phosphatase PrpC